MTITTTTKVLVPVVDPTPFIAFANGYAKKHVRGCEGVKKQRHKGEVRTVPCETCAEIVARFAAIPAHVLPEVLCEPRAVQVKVSLGALLVDGLKNQTLRKGRKSERDFAAGYPVMKAYEKRGGGI